MDSDQQEIERIDISKRRQCCNLHLEKVIWVINGFIEKIKKIAMDDPRRIAHSIKVGLALTLVSSVYYVTPIYDSLGDSAMWAVITVVVVMEYTAGGTLSKGINRTLATLIAGSLAVGAQKIAALCSQKGEGILLAISVFLVAASATFSRYIPEVKARCDYGVTIFIMTFSLVTIASYRVDGVIRLALHRFCTIAIGVVTCLCTSLLVFPIWAGEDIHRLMASNLEKLASFLEGLETECFGEKPKFDRSLIEKPFLQVHKSVLGTKATEDSLLSFAKWEPCHGNFHFHHPWQQYQKVGGLIRQCASSIDALTLYLITLSTNQIFIQPAKADADLPMKIRTACIKMCTESAKALRDLSSAIRSMTVPSLAGQHVSAATLAADIIRTTSSDDMITVGGTIHVVVIVSLLAELVDRTKEIAGSIDELARVAKFNKNTGSVCSAAVKPLSNHEIQEQVSISIVD